MAPGEEEEILMINHAPRVVTFPRLPPDCAIEPVETSQTWCNIEAKLLQVDLARRRSLQAPLAAPIHPTVPADASHAYNAWHNSKSCYLFRIVHKGRQPPLAPPPRGLPLQKSMMMMMMMMMMTMNWVGHLPAEPVACALFS